MSAFVPIGQGPTIRRDSLLVISICSQEKQWILESHVYDDTCLMDSSYLSLPVRRSCCC